MQSYPKCETFNLLTLFWNAYSFKNLYRNFELSWYYIETLMIVAIIILLKRSELSLLGIILQELKKTPGLSPPANYTDRATAACRRS
jgi:hypothetical protein